jgi:hypothetical protein
MESIFSSGGVLDLHPNGTNRLQIPKGWRPRKLFEPKIDGDESTTAFTSPSSSSSHVISDSSGFGKVRGKGVGKSRSKVSKGCGVGVGSRKRPFKDAFASEHTEIGSSKPIRDDNSDDSDSEVKYYDDTLPEEDLDDLVSFSDGIQGVDDGLWTRFKRQTLSSLSPMRLMRSGIASGRGDSSSEKAFNLGWGRAPCELASQSASLALLLPAGPSSSAYAIALCHLYYTHDSNTAQSLLAFVNTAARRFISSMDLNPLLPPELVNISNNKKEFDNKNLFQLEDQNPWQRLTRALSGHGGGRYRGLYLQHISFVANDLTEVFKDERFGSKNKREGESMRRQNARMFFFETFGFNREVDSIEGQRRSVSAWRLVLINLIQAITLSSPSVKEFCSKYRLWKLDLIGKENDELFTSMNGKSSHNSPLPLVSNEITDSASSLFRILLVITGKPACYFFGTRECDEIADEIANAMIFSNEIILSAIGIGVAPTTLESSNVSDEGSFMCIARAAVSTTGNVDESKKTWSSQSTISVIRSLYASPLSHLSLNEYCSRLLADLVLASDDARRYIVDVMSEKEQRVTDDGHEKSSCVLQRAIDSQLFMFLGGQSTLSSTENLSSTADLIPTDVSPETLQRLNEESSSCDTLSELQKNDGNTNPLRAQLDFFSMCIKKAFFEFKSQWNWRHTESQIRSSVESKTLSPSSKAQHSPKLGRFQRSIVGENIQEEIKTIASVKRNPFKNIEGLIFEPLDTICVYKSIERSGTSLSSSNILTKLEKSSVERRLRLISIHRPLSQLMTHFILLLSCVAKRLSMRLNAFSTDLGGRSVSTLITDDVSQSFTNRILLQATSFLRSHIDKASQIILSRDLCHLNQKERNVIRMDEMSSHVVKEKNRSNAFQMIGNISLTAPSSLLFFQSLVNVLSTVPVSLDQVLEATLNLEPLPCIRAQTIYALKAQSLSDPITGSIDETSFNKASQSTKNFLNTTILNLLQCPDRRHTCRQYFQLHTIRGTVTSTKIDYTTLDVEFDESVVLSCKGKVLDGKEDSLNHAKVNIVALTSESKATKVSGSQTASSNNKALLLAHQEKDKKEETAQKARYEAMTAQRDKVSTEEAAQKTRYEELQNTRGTSAIATTTKASPFAPIQTKQEPATSLSSLDPSKKPRTNISSSSITTSLPLPILNQSFSAECKSCTFQLEYKLSDVSNWICGIPITCQMCDNLVAFCCDAEKCKKLNYVTMICSLGQMQSLICFACKKLYGSTQEEVIRKSEKGNVATTHATVLSDSATVANSSSSSSSSSLPAPPVAVSAKSPVRIIFTMPSSKEKDEVVKTTLSPSKTTIMLPSTTSSLTVIPSSPQVPLVVSESAAGRLIAMKGNKVLEKSSSLGV